MKGINVNSNATRVVVALAISLIMAVTAATMAGAAAYTKSVYPPDRINSSTLRSWADLSRDCSGTVGCYNYMKIERKRAWGPEFVAGNWANANGWNSLTTSQPAGCYDYRTVVDSYNDYAGGHGSGVNVGQVGTASNGTKVFRFRTTWSSGWKRYCR